MTDELPGRATAADVSALRLARFFEDLFETGRASAGPQTTALDAANRGVAALDEVLAGRVDWHVRGLPGKANLRVDVATGRASAIALYELLSLAVEPDEGRLGAVGACVLEVPTPAGPDEAVTLDALLLDAPRVLRRFAAVPGSHGEVLARHFTGLVAKSPMTSLRFCGTSFQPPADLTCILPSRSLCEEATAMLGFPGNDADRLAALGKALSSLLGQGGEQTFIALRAYELFSFFCARLPERVPAGGGRHSVEVRSLGDAGGLGPADQAVAAYLRPLGIVAQSPRLGEILAQHPRLDQRLVQAARALV